MRSIRFVYALGEGITLLAAAICLAVLIITFQKSIHSTYVKRQISEVNTVDILFNVYLEENKRSFTAYAELPDKHTATPLMAAFSDIYYADESLQVTQILKKTEKSLLFSGFDLSQNRLAQFIRTITAKGPCYSSMYRSAETDELSVYLVLRRDSGWLIGRIGLETVRQNLQRIAEYTHSIILVATNDGYVLSGSREPLSLAVLPESWQGELRIDGDAYLFARKHSDTLDNDIVILTPITQITPILTSAKRFAFAFCSIIAFLLIAKNIWQTLIIIQPLAQFSAAVGAWTPESRLLTIPARILRFKEISALHHTFQEMIQRTIDAFEKLRRSEAQLRENEERMRGILDTVGAGILAVDPQTFTITYVNPAAARLIGLPREQITGRSCHEVACSAPPGQCPVLDLNLKIDAAERELITADGRHIPVLKTVSRAVLDGQPCLLETLNDLTNLKAAEQEKERLEEQLLHAQKLEAVGQLAGGVAHDFNNLLQAINGFTEMAIEDLGPGHPVRTPLQEVAKAGERAARLVSQLLAFSRRQILRPDYLDINDTVVNLINMLERVIGENIHLRFVPGYGLNAVYADRGMIEQVVMNLCVNARDAMPHGGELVLKTEECRIDAAFCEQQSWAAPGRYVLLSVIDTGQGMDEATLGHIFEPFFTTKEVGKGSGLGLAMVYGIVKQHDGLIHALSSVGTGTTFQVYLPMTERKASDYAETAEEPVRGGSETILLAEDDRRVRILAQRILERAGYTVMCATDGEEALSLYQEYEDKIQFLLLDVMMPKRGGRDVFEAVRQINPDIPCLFASGYNEDTVQKEFILEKGLCLIQKPYRREDLLRKIRGLLDGSTKV